MNNTLKTILVGILSLCMPLVAYSEESGLLHNAWNMRVGEMRLADTYISPLEYKGLAFTLSAEHGRRYRALPESLKWSVDHNWTYGKLYNPAYSGLVTYYGANVGYNTLYTWDLAKGLEVGAGGSMEASGGVKSIPRNVNNVSSVDVSVQLLAAVDIRYVVRTRAVDLRFEYEVLSPVIGGMFVPQYGQSYWSLYESLPHSLSETLHFTSVHNMYGAKGEFIFDMAFRNFTLRTSFMHEHTYWGANELRYYRKNLMGGIGIEMNTEVFFGKEK